jgi:hypothetical protein
MEAMLGISSYSYPISTSKNALSFILIAYTFSSTKLEIKAEQILPGREECGRKRVGARVMGEKWPKQCMHI